MCYKLKELDISKWDVRKVYYLTSTFSDCKSLQKLDVSKWDVSHVSEFDYTFYNCSGLRELNVRNWNVSNAMNMRCMFEESMFKILDLSCWNVNNVRDFTNIFGGCKDLRVLYMTKYAFDCMDFSLRGCKGLTVRLIDADEVVCID